MEKERKIHRVEHFDIFNALPELSILIFSFLPVRSLLILRSVCKWFLSIIDDPKFVKFHLHNFPSNALQNRYLNVYDHKSPYYSVLSSSSPDNEVIVDSICMPEGEDMPYDLSSQDSIDGLVILWEESERTFLLWNPSMRKHRWMSPPSQSIDLTYVAVGYDDARGDYKALVMCLDEAYVYSVKTGSWTALTFDKHKLEGEFFLYDEHLAVGNGIMLLETRYKFLNNTSIWFDYGTETFSYANYAPIGIGCIHNGLLKLDGGSTVGMWGYDSEDQPTIWALDTHTMSYSKRYKVARELMKDLTLSYVEKNGALMLKYLRISEEEKKQYMKELVYDIKTEVIKRRIDIPWSATVYGFYIESMIVP